MHSPKLPGMTEPQVLQFSSVHVQSFISPSYDQEPSFELLKPNTSVYTSALKKFSVTENFRDKNNFNVTTETSVSITPNYNYILLFILISIALCAVWGNLLVCLAVLFKRKLQSMFNCFLVSLAFSDMMSAILVMPLSILRTLVGWFLNF